MRDWPPAHIRWCQVKRRSRPASIVPWIGIQNGSDQAWKDGGWGWVKECNCVPGRYGALKNHFPTPILVSNDLFMATSFKIQFTCGAHSFPVSPIRSLRDISKCVMKSWVTAEHGIQRTLRLGKRLRCFLDRRGRDSQRAPRRPFCQSLSR